MVPGRSSARGLVPGRCSARGQIPGRGSAWANVPWGGSAWRLVPWRGGTRGLVPGGGAGASWGRFTRRGSAGERLVFGWAAQKLISRGGRPCLLVFRRVSSEWIRTGGTIRRQFVFRRRSLGHSRRCRGVATWGFLLWLILGGCACVLRGWVMLNNYIFSLSLSWLILFTIVKLLLLLSLCFLWGGLTVVWLYLVWGLVRGRRRSAFHFGLTRRTWAAPRRGGRLLLSVGPGELDVAAEQLVMLLQRIPVGLVVEEIVICKVNITISIYRSCTISYREYNLESIAFPDTILQFHILLSQWRPSQSQHFVYYFLNSWYKPVTMQHFHTLLTQR